MSDKTAIEWADATINPIRARRMDDVADPRRRMGWHCEHVSEGCRNCYAEALNRDRFGTGLDYKPGHLVAKGGTVEIYLAARALTDMLRWRRPRRIFVCSMTDLFADFVPDWMIDRVFAAMALAPHHTFMLLTKRPERMRAYLSSRKTFDRVVMEMLVLHQQTGCPTVKDRCEQAGLPWTKPTSGHDWWPLRNVWLGVTAEDQTRADERIPVLLETPAAKRFVSVEPMLGAVHLGYIGWPNGGNLKRTGLSALTGGRWIDGEYAGRVPKLNWVICGGESGPGARPMHPDWVRSLRDQCAAAGVPFLFKQWGEWRQSNFDSAPKKIIFWDGRILENTDENASRVITVEDHYAACLMARVGKRVASRLLDGVEHLAFPET